MFSRPVLFFVFVLQSIRKKEINVKKIRLKGELNKKLMNRREILRTTAQPSRRGRTDLWKDGA